MKKNLSFRFVNLRAILLIPTHSIVKLVFNYRHFPAHLIFIEYLHNLQKFRKRLHTHEHE